MPAPSSPSRSARRSPSSWASCPSRWTTPQVAAAIDAVVAETGAAGMSDMGKVMAALKERHAGQMDFGKASAAIKARLSAG